MSNWKVIQHALENTEDLKQDFGVPEQKKFPLYDRAHVKSAIKFFNYVDPAYEEKLATAIINKINEYGMNDINVGDNNRFKNYYDPNVIEHHGIKGMKWGVRRYQNADGSLTALGRKKYGRSAIGSDFNMYKDYKKKYSKTIEKAMKRKTPEEYNIAVENAKEAYYYKELMGDIADLARTYGYEAVKNTFGGAYEKAYNDNYDKHIAAEKRFKTAIDSALDKLNIEKEQTYHRKLREVAHKNDYISDAEKHSIEKDAKRLNSWVESKGKSQVVQQYVQDNKAVLAEKITDMMVDDLKRWGNTNVDKSKIMQQVNKSIDTTDISEYSRINNTEKGLNIEFMINGIDSYSDSAPMTVEYYPYSKYINMSYV